MSEKDRMVLDMEIRRESEEDESVKYRVVLGFELFGDSEMDRRNLQFLLLSAERHLRDEAREIVKEVLDA